VQGRSEIADHDVGRVVGYHAVDVLGVERRREVADYRANRDFVGRRTGLRVHLFLSFLRSIMDDKSR
jgi:hypothetical protein